MDPLSLALLHVDWSSLDHAYGPAEDAPGQLLALAGDDPEGRRGAVGYLDAAMLHQGSVYSATAPFIKIVAMLLADPGDRRTRRRYPPVGSGAQAAPGGAAGLSRRIRG